ncbi:hypothetical protein ACFL5V_00800 [Fibrobacterota bacterium]
MLNQNVKTSQIISAPESLTNVLGVVYIHKKARDGGDLYLTRFGIQRAGLLEIENWYDKTWFYSRGEQLEGTSSVFRVPTKEVKGKSIELVVKNCRVGEDVPLETKTLLEFINTEFNSPWEEFALVMEMRDGAYGPGNYSIRTQEPLAIYVPPERMQLWQSGRSKDKVNRIKSRHPGIELDILRQYKLIYGWIKGKNIIEVFELMGLKGAALKKNLRPITLRAIADLDRKGYAVADMKPEHIIIAENDLKPVEQEPDAANGAGNQKDIEYLHSLIEQYRYSVVDYELLVRTPDHEKEVKAARRHSYLLDQRDRYVATDTPSHLRKMDIFGVPYVYGKAESTDGRLWVVGANSRLFDYFLPERWRNTEGWKLSDRNDIFYSHTKDDLHIVWKTSLVGDIPSPGLWYKAWDNVALYGFNSPFEEFAIADYLNKCGIQTVYTRAIYMTGSKKLNQPLDLSRYETHRLFTCPDGFPVLSKDHNYITIRGYFNGPDEWVALQKGKLYRPISLSRALVNHAISQEEYNSIFNTLLEKLNDAGVDGSLLKGNDVLLAFDPAHRLVRDKQEKPEARICNFERLYRR